MPSDWNSFPWAAHEYYPENYDRSNLDLALDEPQFTLGSRVADDSQYVNNPLMQIVAIRRAAEQIHFFSDFRQPKFDDKPLPDGSNIIASQILYDGTVSYTGLDLLRSTFRYYRRWLEFLHLKSILIGNDAQLLQNAPLDDRRITQSLAHGLREEILGILRSERSNIPRDKTPLQYVIREDAEPIMYWRQDVIRTLNDIRAAALWARQHNEIEGAAMQQVL